MINRAIEEVLYPAMEDFCLDIVVGKGPSARSIRLDLPPFTLIGATTRAGALSAPLRDRFGVPLRLEYYEVEPLKEIVVRSAGLFEVNIDEQAAMEIARRSRGTPRDTLWKIARQYGIPFEELKRVNAHLANPDYIVPGMKIFLPTKKHIQK